LAGIRVGYGFAPKPLVQAIDQVREPFNVNTCAQAGAIASLYDTDELKRRVALNSRCRQRLQEGFAALGLKYYPSEANYVWVEIPDPQATFDQLLQRGIIVRPVPGARALRVGVGDDAGVAATLTAFTELFS
jgi:histidinol-phosphate aminotransferase